MAGVYNALDPGKRLILFLYSAFHFAYPSHKVYKIKVVYFSFYFIGGFYSVGLFCKN